MSACNFAKVLNLTLVSMCQLLSLYLSDIQGATSINPPCYVDATLQEATYDVVIHLGVNDISNNQSHDQMT